MLVVFYLLLLPGVSAIISILLGWLAFDFHWALRNAYFGIGVGSFLFMTLVILSNLRAAPGDSLFEKLQKVAIRSQSSKGWAVIKLAVGLFAQLFLFLAYWPTILMNLAATKATNPKKLSDIQNLMRRAAGRQPIILASSMMAQNLCVLIGILVLPSLRTNPSLRVGLIIAMVANVLWLLEIALTPIEVRLRQSMSPAQAFRLFLLFLLVTFLADAILLQSFRLMFNQGASFGQASLDLLTMGQYNPAIAKLTDDLTKSATGGDWQHLIEAARALPIDLVFSWSICFAFGSVIASRAFGILTSRGSFQRTEVEQVGGAITALLSNDMESAQTFITELPKNHYVVTLFDLQKNINDLAFNEALAKVPTLVKRKRHALQLDDEVVLTEREKWFVVVYAIAALDIPRLWVAALLWSAGEQYLCDRDFLQLLQGRLVTHGRQELETELHYVVAVAQHQGNDSERIRWFAEKRDFVANIADAGQVTEASELDQIAQLMFLNATNQLTFDGIVKSRAYRSMPKEWDDLVLAPLSIDFLDLIKRMMSSFETAEPLDQQYCLNFLRGFTAAAEAGAPAETEAAQRIVDEARGLLKSNEERLFNRYGDAIQSIEVVTRQLKKMKFGLPT